MHGTVAAIQTILTVAVTIMGTLTGTVTGRTVTSWTTQYDAEFEFDCQDRLLIGLESEHHNSREDRVFNFRCGALPGGSQLTSCAWSEYVNQFGRPANYECPEDGVLTGISSYHDNDHEDRRWKFRCCKPVGLTFNQDCTQPGNVNEWDGYFNYSVPRGRALTGVMSYHCPYRKDRIFDFKTCQELECPSGTYGLNCGETCSGHCTGSCNPVDGSCDLGCEPGYTGSRCESVSNLEWKCIFGCDLECQPGYTGSRCESECPSGKYGLNCGETCSGHCTGSCNHIDGSCDLGCQPGYTGSRCESECPSGTYGPNCTETCSSHCTGSCNPVDGSCDLGCEPGYAGFCCESECPSGTYGLNCGDTCSGHCRGSCSHIDGSCDLGCEPGYTGSPCESECPSGKYGLNCGETCSSHCTGSCNQVDGSCDIGCEPGYTGSRCESECPSGTYGLNCGETCSSHCTGSCNYIDGSCDLGCEPGYTGSRCESECPSGTYGLNCGEKCSGHCRGSCNHVNGSCDLGCEPGYTGSRCESATMCEAGMTGPRESVIYPSSDSPVTVPYLCHSGTHGAGWIVFQRRRTGQVSFNRTWSEYRDGFGSFDGDFWLGLEALHNFTTSGTFELRIDLECHHQRKHAEYSRFAIAGESENYKLELGAYREADTGDQMDSLSYHSGSDFSTWDRDNDHSSSCHCARDFNNGGWWFRSCHRSNLNGLWNTSGNMGTTWKSFNERVLLISTEMKIRQIDDFLNPYPYNWEIPQHRAAILSSDSSQLSGYSCISVFTVSIAYHFMTRLDFVVRS